MTGDDRPTGRADRPAPGVKRWPAGEPTPYDALPPAAQLVVEVLIARHRLGERCWTFTNRHRQHLRILEANGWCWWKQSSQQGYVLAWLTDEALPLALPDLAGNGPGKGWSTAYEYAAVDRQTGEPVTTIIESGRPDDPTAAAVSRSHRAEVSVRTVTRSPWRPLGMV